MIRKIPSTMVSQHPDNASKPYWHTEAYISDQYEVKECYLAFSKLGVLEYKWDWEGKFVDESVFERLISTYASFFLKNQLGKDKFLTFRLPDYRVKTEFRLGRALMCILSASGLAGELGLHTPPMFEAILPMTTSASEIISVQEAFSEIANLKHPFYNNKNGKLKHIEIIPLFEDVNTIINSDNILKEYIGLHKKKFEFSPSYIRPYLARSDSALSSGLVPSVIAIKIALSRYKKLEQKEKIKLYPIIGAGSLPFRGGSTPFTVPQFAEEYRGVKTVLIQSAFQYDFETKSVIEAIKKFEKLLPLGVPKKITAKEEKTLMELIGNFASYYQETVKGIGRMVYMIGMSLPPRRGRLKHTGLLKYPRMVGRVKIPRAIGFTAVLYSLGIPPEFIGTGRGIKELRRKGSLKLLERIYPGLKADLERAGRYVNKEVLSKISKRSNDWKKILEDIEEIEKYLGYKFSPITTEEKAHLVFTNDIYDKFMDGIYITGLIEEAAILRKSLG